MSDGYLFPTPGFVLRSLLDELADGDDEFTKPQAAADIMLAMDRDDVRPIRYYAKRWDWSKSKVHRHMDDLKMRAKRWRAFNKLPENGAGQERDTRGTRAGQESPNTADKAGNQDSGGTTAGQERDSIVQNTKEQQNKDVERAGAREKSDSSGYALVDIWRDVSGTPPLRERTERQLIRWEENDEVTHPETFRKVLARSVESTAGRGVGLDMGYLKEDYEDAVEEETPTGVHLDDSDDEWF